MKTGFVSILGRPECRQVDAAERAVRPEARHRDVSEAADHAHVDSRRGYCAGLSNRVRRIRQGIHRSNTLMNKRMMDTVRASASADVVAVPRLIDVLEPLREEDAEAVDLIKKLEAPGDRGP